MLGIICREGIVVWYEDSDGVEGLVGEERVRDKFVRCVERCEVGECRNFGDHFQKGLCVCPKGI